MFNYAHWMHFTRTRERKIIKLRMMTVIKITNNWFMLLLLLVSSYKRISIRLPYPIPALIHSIWILCHEGTFVAQCASKYACEMIKTKSAITYQVVWQSHKSKKLQSMWDELHHHCHTHTKKCDNCHQVAHLNERTCTPFFYKHTHTHTLLCTYVFYVRIPNNSVYNAKLNWHNTDNDRKMRRHTYIILSVPLHFLQMIIVSFFFCYWDDINTPSTFQQ